MNTFFGLNEARNSLIASPRRAVLTAVLLASALTAAAPAVACNVAELSNGWVKPIGNPTGFEVDFVGNVTSTIPAQITADAMTNAFAALQLFNGSLVNTTTVAYDSVANLTRVNFSSQGALPNPVPANWGSYGPDQYNDTYHFGLNAGWACADPTITFTPVSEHWIYPSGPNQEVPFLNGSWAGTFTVKSKNVLWALLYTETKEQSTGGWQLIAYPKPKIGGAVKINLTNGSQTPEVIGNTGYLLNVAAPTGNCLQSPQCAANQAALDQLNGEFIPVPGTPGSPLTQLKVSQKPIPPGKSITLTLK